MNEFICFIKSVPDVIWSAIIASGLTILGVILTNRGNNKRQDKLLKYENDKFIIEQQHNLKKEVLLNMASSFSNVVEVIPNMINLEFSETEMKEKIKGHSGNVSKAYLIADENSLKEILDYSTKWSKIFIELSKYRAEILDYKKAMDIYKNCIKENNEEKERLFKLIETNNIENQQSIKEYFYTHYQLLDEQNNGFQNKIEELEKDFNPKYEEFSKSCLNYHSELILSISPMVIALRKELNSDKNSEVFINALEKSNEDMKNIFRTLFN